MAIISATSSITGLVGITPNLVFINTNDTAAAVLATGYLSKAVEENLITVQRSSLAFVNTTQGALLLAISITGTAPNLVYSLIPTTNPGGSIYAGNVQAGLNGTAGALISYPATVNTGHLQWAATANGGAFNALFTNAALGQTTTFTVPDPGAATANVLVSTTLTGKVKTVIGAAAAGGAAAQSFTDAFCTTGSKVDGNWVTQANAASILKITPGNGSFVVTSSADAGIGTFSYTIIK